MTEPLTSCSQGSNWTLGDSFGEMSRMMNRRLDYERDMRYWNRDLVEYKDETCYENENIEYVCEPVEMPEVVEPEEPGSPLTPQARGSASKRNKVKLTGKASFYADD